MTLVLCCDQRAIVQCRSCIAGLFVCGHRRIYFPTRPRTTSYKRRTWLAPPTETACCKEDPQQAAPHHHLAPPSSLLTKTAAARGTTALHLAFASPPLAASTSHLQSVQTAAHFKRLGAEYPDSCKPAAREGAAASIGGASLDGVVRPRQLQLGRHLAVVTCSQAEGLGESVMPAVTVDSPLAVPRLPAVSDAGGPGDGSSVHGTPRSRMCTPRSCEETEASPSVKGARNVLRGKWCISGCLRWKVAGQGSCLF